MAERARVLVVDDERFFREAIGDALAAAAIPSETAVNGEEALRRGRDPGIGAVVLDLGLPGLGGIEVLRQLREERPLVRVLVLAAQSEQGAVLEALRLGACDYLAKPLHDEELVLAVRRALEAHAVESSWSRLRGRMRVLEARMSGIAVKARDASPATRGEAVAQEAAEAVAQVLGADRTSVMLFDPVAGELRVAGTCGRDLPPSEMDVVLLGEGVAGKALALGEAMAVTDLGADPRFDGRAPLARYDTSSFAVAPVEGFEHPVAVLCATDRLGGPPFGDEDLTLLRLMALQLGPILSAPASAPAKQEELPLLPAEEITVPDGEGDVDLAREVCDAISNEVEPERLFAAALAPAARALGAEPVSIYLIDNESGALVLECQREAGRPDRPRLPRDRGLSGAVLQTGWLVATGEPEADARFDRSVDTAEDGAVRPFLCVPLRLRGKVFGLLRAFPSDPAAASARSGEVLAAVFSAAVRNALMYRSLLESIEEVAEARRATRGTG